jgi:hypothetical protein
MLVRPAEVDEVMKLVARVFEPVRSLPERVPRLGLPSTPFFDGNAIFGEEGWAMLSSIARLHDDARIALAVLDYPLGFTGDPEVFAYEFVLAGIDEEGDTQKYIDLLYAESKSGDDHWTIGDVADRLVFIGGGARWGLWIERDLAGIVCAANPYELGNWLLDFGPFLDVYDALEGFVGGNTRDDAGFASELIQNYGYGVADVP